MAPASPRTCSRMFLSCSRKETAPWRAPPGAWASACQDERLRGGPAAAPAARLGKDVPGGLTGYGQEEDVRRASEAGFDRHLVKPVDLLVLKSLLSSLPE